MKLTTLATVAMIALAPAAFAADEVNTSNGLTLNGNPLGMHGFDPASMFNSDAPMIGDAQFTATHDGVDYYFATAEAKADFTSDPVGMLPQFMTTSTRP